MTSIILFILGFFGWFFSTVAAGGAATILIPLIAFLLGAQLVAPVISVAALIANPSRVYVFRKNIDWQIIRYLLPGTIFGSILGAWSFAQANSQVIQIILGIFLICYAARNTLKKPKYFFKMRLKWFFSLGFCVSFLSGLIGATGPIQNPFMLNYGLSKENLIGTKAVNSLFMQFTKLLSYGFFGVLTFEIASYGVIIGIGAIFGIMIAQKHLRSINAVRFKLYMHILMLFCGILLLFKAF